MIKKAVLWGLILLSAVNLHAQQEEIPWRENITMLVVPREPMAVQLAQDISRRYPVLLVCYQRTPAQPIIHAWNGKEWVGVSTADYTTGTFFTKRPRHAVIVEEEGNPAPDLLIPNGTWCDNGNRLSSTDTRVMIHLLGRYFDFPYRYWVQFAKRYDYPLEEINPSLLNVIWWHYQGDEAVAAFKARDYQRDMNKWSELNITPPTPIEPVVLEKPAELPSAEIPAEKIVDEPSDETAAEKPTRQHVKIIIEDKETTAPTAVETNVIENTVEEQQAEITETLEEVTAEEGMNPFSTNEIPAAEIILPK